MLLLGLTSWVGLINRVKKSIYFVILHHLSSLFIHIAHLTKVIEWIGQNIGNNKENENRSLWVTYLGILED